MGEAEKPGAVLHRMLSTAISERQDENAVDTRNQMRELYGDELSVIDAFEKSQSIVIARREALAAVDEAAYQRAEAQFANAKIFSPQALGRLNDEFDRSDARSRRDNEEYQEEVGELAAERSASEEPRRRSLVDRLRGR